MGSSGAKISQGRRCSSTFGSRAAMRGPVSSSKNNDRLSPGEEAANARRMKGLRLVG